MKKILTLVLGLVTLALPGIKGMNPAQTDVLNTGYNEWSQHNLTTNFQKDACTSPPPGMVGWWPLEETRGTAVSDQSPLGNHGTASNTIGSSSNPKSVAGFVGNGMNFYFGTRVRIKPNSSLDFGSNKSFTIDAWIKGHSSPIVNNVTSTKSGYGLFFGNNNKLRFDMGNGGNQLMSWDGPLITREAWTFVAVVVDRTNKKVTLYAADPGGALVASSGLPAIPASANAGAKLPLDIGGCPGNPNGCDTILDEVEIFDRALTQSELQNIVNAGNGGKCSKPPKKGMTWLHTTSNNQYGTITVGCGQPPNGCETYKGDTLCTQPLPVLCIYKPQPAFKFPVGLKVPDQYNRWSGGVVATTPPVAGNTFPNITDANSHCEAVFGKGWRVAEFHDGWGWNFQAYGGTVSAPAVPSTRFWVHINTTEGNCWQQ
ncbi:MAG: LamG domain-containing protein [Acidobacteriota bacterium]